MRSPVTRSIAALTLALLGLAAGGCKSTPSMGRYDIEVSLDPSMVRADGSFPTVEVDLVGVNPDADGPRWDNYSVTQYFTPGDQMRTGANKFQIRFRKDKADKQVIAARAADTDATWNTWKNTGVMSLYVLASLPGVHEDKPGANDDRRLIIPLDKRRWNVSKLQLVVKESGITLLQQPKPIPQ